MHRRERERWCASSTGLVAERAGNCGILAGKQASPENTRQCVRLSAYNLANVHEQHRLAILSIHRYPTSCVCVCARVCMQHRLALLSPPLRQGTPLTRLAGNAKEGPADASCVPHANVLREGVASLERLQAHACDTRGRCPTPPDRGLVNDDVAPLQSQLRTYSLCGGD